MVASSRVNANKEADVAEHPQVFDHVGLLFNRPVAVATCPSSSHPTSFVYVVLGVRTDRDDTYSIGRAAGKASGSPSLPRPTERSQIPC